MHSYISRYSVLAYSIKVSWRFAECLSRVSEGFRGVPRSFPLVLLVPYRTMTSTTIPLTPKYGVVSSWSKL